MRLVFMGTPDFSVPTLETLLAAGHQVVAVYSQPPSRAGRGKQLRPSPVHSYAEQYNIPVYTPQSLRHENELEIFASHHADAAIVIAYGLLLPQAILDSPVYGCLNLHASLLPRWRGAAPIQRAIMAGDVKTGIMVMKMEAGLDTGPVCLSHETDIPANMTAGELHDELKMAGGPLIVQALEKLQNNSLTFKPQSEEGVTYAKKIDKAESRIDWTRPAHELHNHIRGLSPFPGSWFEFKRDDGKSERIKVLASQVEKDTSSTQVPPGVLLDDRLLVSCGDVKNTNMLDENRQALRLIRLQRAGKKTVLAEDFLRGFKAPPGKVLE